MWDIIGDIHGHADALLRLLRRLGYERISGGWTTPSAQHSVIFVGDVIDRGPEIRRSVGIVRSLIDAGKAHIVMGNHEYNALGWHTPAPDGSPLRTHSSVHRRQHERTLAEFAGDGPGLADLLAWIRTLPLFFENEDLRVVHAAWDDAAVDDIRSRPDACGDDEFLRRSVVAGQRESTIAEILLKGVEVGIPDGHRYHDKEGTPRYRTRTRWWLSQEELQRRGGEAIPFSSIAMPPADEELGHIVIDPAHLAHLPGYDDRRPVFVGHYWLSGPPKPLGPRIACVDYSVARDGYLCAYRFRGERTLSADHFVCVPPPPDGATDGT